ncbi:MAG: lytic transglycosylase domain-containing protein, partial [Burkholderiaceae bacterium]
MRALLGLLIATCLAGAGGLRAQAADATLLDAREALRKKDRDRLAELRAAMPAGHPLAVWTDYWELSNRLPTAQQDELDAFYARWRGTYLEDRLRNDWLLELGRRRDWPRVAVEFPRFRMNDDREVTCYALLADQAQGKPVAEPARAAWLAQREPDDGCALLAATLVDAKVFSSADVWSKVRLSMEAGRPRSARQSAALLGPTLATGVADVVDSPVKYLMRKAGVGNRGDAELTALALVRLSNSDVDGATRFLVERWDRQLPDDLAAWAWASVAKQSAIKLAPDAADLYQRAALRAGKKGTELELPDDSLAWKVRAALRADNGRPRWQQVTQAINGMSESEQRDPAWVFWKARALRAVARHSQEGHSMRTLSDELLRSIAGQMNFYGALAAESLRQPLAMPAPPAPLTPAERTAARA